jgi:hypothetical protein
MNDVLQITDEENIIVQSSPTPTPTISVQRLEQIKTSIEKMNKQNNIEVLRILKKYNFIKLNENKSGIFVNITFLPNNILFELENYIQYVNDQEKTFQELEIQKEEYKHYLF